MNKLVLNEYDLFINEMDEEFEEEKEISFNS